MTHFEDLGVCVADLELFESMYLVGVSSAEGVESLA
jgi:hypothetical protein